MNWAFSLTSTPSQAKSRQAGRALSSPSFYHFGRNASNNRGFASGATLTSRSLHRRPSSSGDTPCQQQTSRQHTCLASRSTTTAKGRSGFVSSTPHRPHSGDGENSCPVLTFAPTTALTTSSPHHHDGGNAGKNGQSSRATESRTHRKNPPQEPTAPTRRTDPQNRLPGPRKAILHVSSRLESDQGTYAIPNAQ